jgi:hypothetical protein
MSSPGNPCNEAYKLASKKKRNTVKLTMLRKTDGSNPTNIIEILTFIIEKLIPEDNAQDDTDLHMSTRRLTEQPIETTDDRFHPVRNQTDH